MVTYQELNPRQRQAIKDYLSRTGLVVNEAVLRNMVNAQRIYGKIRGADFLIYNQGVHVGTLRPDGIIWL